MDSFSVAEARNNITQLLHDVEDGGPVQITRRGRPVAILVSVVEYERLTGKGADLAPALEGFDASAPKDDRFDDSFFDGLRDPSQGREVTL